MDTTPDLSRIASTVGDARRIQMLALLMEGRALTAKELALGAGVEPATATAHLRRLQDDGLVDVTSQGRHKYFRLASEQVAGLVESLMLLAPRLPVKKAAKAGRDPIMLARYCYDHLAGELGTGLLAMMLAKKWLTSAENVADPIGGKALALSARGEKSLMAIGVEVQAALQRRRQFACRCLDWSERRDHLGGALGAALAARLAELAWIERQKHSRVVRITPAGEKGFLSLGVKMAQPAAGPGITTMPSRSA